MSALWYKEWREFAGARRLLLLRLILPLLIFGPLMRSEALRIPALAGALVYLGAYATATQMARERVSGFLPRLALTPMPPGHLVLTRVLSRTLLLALQAGPLLALAAWYGAPTSQLLLFVPGLPAACAAGALIGLRAPSRRGAQLAGLVTACAAVALGFKGGPPAPPVPPAATGDLVAMSMATPGLPAHATLWLLTAGLVAAAVFTAPAILRPSEE